MQSAMAKASVSMPTLDSPIYLMKCCSLLGMLPLGARTLLGAPGLTTRNKKLLGAKGIATRSKDATSSSTQAVIPVCHAGHLVLFLMVDPVLLM